MGHVLQNWYFGNQRSMLIPNCLFRIGGAAILLSNKRTERWRAKCASHPAALLAVALKSSVGFLSADTGPKKDVWCLYACDTRRSS